MLSDRESYLVWVNIIKDMSLTTIEDSHLLSTRCQLFPIPVTAKYKTQCVEIDPRTKHQKTRSLTHLEGAKHSTLLGFGNVKGLVTPGPFIPVREPSSAAVCAITDGPTFSSLNLLEDS